MQNILLLQKVQQMSTFQNITVLIGTVFILAQLAQFLCHTMGDLFTFFFKDGSLIRRDTIITEVPRLYPGIIVVSPDILTDEVDKEVTVAKLKIPDENTDPATALDWINIDDI